MLLIHVASVELRVLVNVGGSIDFTWQATSASSAPITPYSDASVSSDADIDAHRRAGYRHS